MNGYGRTYLVVLRQFLVAQDIALTIAEFDPDAHVIVAVDMAAAASQIKGDVYLAFVEMPLGHAGAGQLRLEAGNGVLVGDGVLPPEMAGWAQLDLPFTTDQVLALLHRHRTKDGTCCC